MHMAKITTLFLIALAFCLLQGPLLAQDWRPSLITDPGLTSRCKELLDNRQKKILIKQKLTGLLSRNQRLLKRTPPNKVSIKDKLLIQRGRIERELELVKARLATMDENIIRRGCPGISL